MPDLPSFPFESDVDDDVPFPFRSALAPMTDDSPALIGVMLTASGLPLVDLSEASEVDERDCAAIAFHASCLACMRATRSKLLLLLLLPGWEKLLRLCQLLASIGDVGLVENLDEDEAGREGDCC